VAINKLITAPSGNCVTLTDVKAQLRIDTSDDDTLLERMIDTAEDLLQNRYGWAFLTQTREEVLDAFPSGMDEISLQFPIVTAISSIKYIDEDNVEQTWPATEWQYDIDGTFARIKPAYGYEYPDTYPDTFNVVRVRYVTGYATVATVPNCIKHAILLLIGDWYENREAFNLRTIPGADSDVLDALMANYCDPRKWAV